MSHASSFTFGAYHVDTLTSTLSFTYTVTLASGKKRTYTDRLFLKNIPPDAWAKVPQEVLESTLQALLIMLGINYWAVYPSRTLHIEGFSLTREQAKFWNTLYLNGMGEYFYHMQMDFRGLIDFPYNDSLQAPLATSFPRPAKALLLHGAGKDSVLSAEMLKASGVPFDFFAFSPSLAHERIAAVVGADTISVTRARDWRLTYPAALHRVSAAYPSVSTFTFVATLLAELLGYDSIVFSNERSADSGNLTFKGLEVNHQWCKSSEAEKLINDYIQKFITPDIKTYSLLRKFSELEIVRQFIQYPQYLTIVTSCNCYFWFSRLEQRFLRTPYWCRECPKCVFLFACFAAFLPKNTVVSMFGADMYAQQKHLPMIKRILGIEGFKPLDCVGEPEEMILAMHYAQQKGEYASEPALRLFEKEFPEDYDFGALEKKVFAVTE